MAAPNRCVSAVFEGCVAEEEVGGGVVFTCGGPKVLGGVGRDRDQVVGEGSKDLGTLRATAVRQLCPALWAEPASTGTRKAGSISPEP